MTPAADKPEPGLPGTWQGEAMVTPGHRVSIMYVAYPNNVSTAEIERAVRVVVDRVGRAEATLRRIAAAAWLPTFHEECAKARGWDEERLARSFTLRSIILGNKDATFILEYATVLPVHSHLKTWFNPDGTLSHISGHPE